MRLYFLAGWILGLSILAGCATPCKEKATAPMRKGFFSRKEIIFPKGKADIEKFLALLKDPENKKVVGIADGPVRYKEIPQEGSALFSIGSDTYMLYHDDMNNDGKTEYLIIYLFSGSGSYSGVHGAYALDGQKLKSLDFDKIVVSNLFPGHDMSRFHLYLARPFAVHVNGKTYLRFIDDPMTRQFFVYLWQGEKFTPANP